MSQQKIIRHVATNDRGYRIGESHPKSRLSDTEVDQIRDLHEYSAWTYCELAVVYRQSKWAIARICRYERRNQAVEKWKKIEIMEGA